MSRPIRAILLFLFLCSGATALVYEVLWSKFLSQMLGSTVYAQTVVLATFMGGLALGNRLLGNWSDRLANPIKIYGFLEIGIGIYGCAFSILYGFADQIFVSVGSKLVEHGWAVNTLKAVLSVTLLLVPTTLMGGTLPLLAAWLKKRHTNPGQLSALFYAINSIGAVVGAGLAAFYLVESWGMVASLMLAGLTNVLVGFVAFLLSRQDELDLAAPPATQPATPIGDVSSASPWVWAATLVAITGGVSMGLEIVAARSLALLFGSSLQSFAVVLMAFILGIGLGSTAISSARLQKVRSERLILALLCAAGLWVGLLVYHIQDWTEFYIIGKSAIARSTAGYTLHQFLTAAMAMGILGVPAALVGAVLPLLIRTVAPNTAAMGQAVGRLLTWNTLGAVGGVLVTGFVLMPHFGLRASFLVLAMGLAVSAGLIGFRQRWLPGMAAAGACVVLLALAMVTGAENWRHVISAGVFRWKPHELLTSYLDQRKNHVKILFYEDAPDATVSIEQGDGIAVRDMVSLRINGKTDASSGSDLCTQLMSGHVPMLAKPNAKEVFILGLGSGVTGAAVLAHPVNHLTIAENCEPVIRAARFFDPWNRGVLTNPLTRVVRDDARTVLKLSPKIYDVIITEPSNPWTAGVGSVFSLEFYQLAASRMQPDGVILQWFHLYENADHLVTLVLRTVSEVFPYIEIWDCGLGDILIMGSRQPWDASPNALRVGFERPEVKKDMERLGILSPEAMLLRQLASQRTAFAIPGDGPMQTDLFPVLEYESPRAFFRGLMSELLIRYDERTRQENIAPPDKKKVLSALEHSQIQRAFAEFDTINGEFLKSVAWHLRPQALLTEFTNAYTRVNLPSILRSPPPPTITNDIPQHADANVRKILEARTLIVAGQVDEGARIMEEVLKTASPDTSLAGSALLAAEAYLKQGNFDKMKLFLALTHYHSPGHPQIPYLARIAQRVESTATSSAKPNEQAKSAL